MYYVVVDDPNGLINKQGQTVSGAPKEPAPIFGNRDLTIAEKVLKEAQDLNPTKKFDIKWGDGI